MALALFCYDDLIRSGGESSDLERLLLWDFAVQGHSVAYWCKLDELNEDGELSSMPTTQRVFAITPHMRRIWLRSVDSLTLD